MPRGEIFVGNLHRKTQRHDLEEVFRQYGRLIRCDMKYGWSSAYAFIEYEVERDAEDAIKSEHGRVLNGMRTVVEWVKSGPRQPGQNVVRNDRYSRNICYNCMESGHHSWECPKDTGLQKPPPKQRRSRSGSGPRVRKEKRRSVSKSRSRSNDRQARRRPRRSQSYDRTHNNNNGDNYDQRGNNRNQRNQRSPPPPSNDRRERQRDTTLKNGRQESSRTTDKNSSSKSRRRQRSVSHENGYN
ncbi:unnamed protein product [Didymodactylos carnosus]|uniref:Uncharacterized protein n=2 Tax=Didymodactylos carnosus TaxID=1234261 RepID=A0A814RMW7_9BILA|nr:unnamed protein product [Didymodactylos carnosus]CAF3900030.1 unnamed protein product [Didymodactylos carnosus]